jgi:predicted RNA binding protein YcfA (HicA-like mRNA interferase family)
MNPISSPSANKLTKFLHQSPLPPFPSRNPGVVTDRVASLALSSLKQPKEIPLTKTHLPTIKPTQPLVKLDDMPNDASLILNGLKAVEIRVSEVLWVLAMRDLFELANFFPVDDIQDLSMMISYIFSAPRILELIDRTESDYAKKVLADVNETIDYLFPKLGHALENLWKDKESRFAALIRQFKPARATLAKRRIKGMQEHIDYVAKQCKTPQSLIQLSYSSTLHVKSSNQHPPHTTEDWLKFMLQCYSTMQFSFFKDTRFWSFAESVKNGIDSKTSFSQIKSHVEQLLSSRKISEANLLNLYETIQPYSYHLGGVHSLALWIQQGQGISKSCDPIGFLTGMSHLLENEMKRYPDFGLRLAMISITVPTNYFHLHKQLGYIADAALFASLAGLALPKTLKSDGDTLKKIIEETNQILTFFETINVQVTKLDLFISGGIKLSLADLVNHLKGCSTLISMLANDEAESSHSLLNTLFDLYQTTNRTLVMGVEASLICLQVQLSQLQEQQASSSHSVTEEESRLQLLEEIREQIDSISGFTDLILEKTPVLYQLLKTACNVQDPEKQVASPASKKQISSSKRKKKTTRTQKLSKQKTVSMTEKDVSLSFETLSPVIPEKDKTTKEQRVSDPLSFSSTESADQKETEKPITQLTENLIKAVSTFQQSVKNFSEQSASVHNVKWSALCKELKKAGWELLRSKGSHRQYIHPKAKKIGLAVLPVNSKDSLSTGVVKDVRGLIKQANDSISKKDKTDE